MKSIRLQWDRVLPYRAHIQSNPIFLYELRRLRLQQFNANLSKYGLRVILGIPAIAVIWWMLERFPVGSVVFTTINPGWEYYLPDAILLISLLFTAFSSFATSMMTVNSMQYHLDSGQWDDLRLTPQSYNFNLVTSDITIGQIRAWRFTIVEMALRLTSAMLILLNLLYFSWFNFRPHDDLIGWILWLTLGAVIGGIIAGIYILEPLFRIRLLVAFCMAITLRFENLINAILFGLSVVAMLHLIQFGVFLSLWYLAIPSPYDLIPLGLICGVPMAGFFVAFVFGYLYQFVKVRVESFLWQAGATQ